VSYAFAFLTRFFLLTHFTAAARLRPPLVVQHMGGWL
jgi:hypothetical protein